MKFLTLVIFLLFPITLYSEENVLSENAPKDKPISNTASQMEEFFRAIEPYSNEAKKTYPEAKQKFLDDLPQGENLFLTTRLHDIEDRVEQVFILVKEIQGNTIKGVIYNDVRIVSGFEFGQEYEFPETEVYDWLISKPDGSEDGNYIGKFLDTYQR